MLKPVRELLRLVYVEQIDIVRINREDFEGGEVFEERSPQHVQDVEEVSQEQGQESGLKAWGVVAAERERQVCLDASGRWPGEVSLFRQRSFSRDSLAHILCGHLPPAMFG